MTQRVWRRRKAWVAGTGPAMTQRVSHGRKAWVARASPAMMQRFVALAGKTNRARPRYTSRLCSTAAPTKDANRGCGSNGRDLSSG
jgi:hypothetical protein